MTKRHPRRASSPIPREMRLPESVLHEADAPVRSRAAEPPAEDDEVAGAPDPSPELGGGVWARAVAALTGVLGRLSPSAASSEVTIAPRRFSGDEAEWFDDAA